MLVTENSQREGEVEDKRGGLVMKEVPAETR